MERDCFPEANDEVPRTNTDTSREIVYWNRRLVLDMSSEMQHYPVIQTSTPVDEAVIRAAEERKVEIRQQRQSMFYMNWIRMINDAEANINRTPATIQSIRELSRLMRTENAKNPTESLIRGLERVHNLGIDF